MVADSILTRAQPFPGDEHHTMESFVPELRFSVAKHMSGDLYSIYDRLVEERVLIAESTLRKPQFDISRWYAKHRNRARGLNSPVTHHCAMGPAISIMATKLLMDGISSHYPSLRTRSDSRPCFLVTQTPYSKQTNEFVIVDWDTRGHFYLDKAQLDTPSFDLVGWYTQRVIEDRACRQRQGDSLSPDIHDCGDTHKLMSCAKLLSRMALNSLHVEDSESADLMESQDRDDDPDFEDDVDNPQEDYPSLAPLSDSEDGEDDDQDDPFEFEDSSDEPFVDEPSGIILANRLARVLTSCQPYPGDGPPLDPRYQLGDIRFIVER